MFNVGDRVMLNKAACDTHAENLRTHQPYPDARTYARRTRFIVLGVAPSGNVALRFEDHPTLCVTAPASDLLPASEATP